MTKVCLVMGMSLDGFINDRNGSTEKLQIEPSEFRQSPLLRDLIADTGAVVMGQHTYDMAPNPDAYADTYELQVSLFIVTDKAPEHPPKHNDKLTITFVTDGIESAINQAKQAAGAKQVTVVGGANLDQQLLNAGLIDELQIGITPVLLGKGLRLFENLDVEIQLEKYKIIETGQRTDLFFTVKNSRK